ncbi:LPXTG cell wall anchor domain-containing protein [Clavibacter lycopersici]|uniref:LPXTG cell wall anchor domain-containing protein n=1 Tax=Clavibacter lycopersici TaxID=2301718 RepID=A0A399SRX4_9MICO|nr:LPXTG cell wall anchor domain-containing protein [Clavibacter lycopersici]RIJ45212.1 LPXTG cell wall anchor domain-containing protein [Clavibacter lycopersici]RIJ57557.1 LPXTG cell wall anchor domain-containing protein [Clavibacter lycopersici]
MDLTPAAARTVRLRRPVTALCLTAALVAAPLAWAPAAFAAVDPATGTTQTEAVDATPSAAGEAAPEAIETPAVESPAVEAPAVESPVVEAPAAEAEPAAADAPVREPASIAVDDDTLDPDQPVDPGIALEATGFLPGEPVTVSITAPAGVQVDLLLQGGVGSPLKLGPTHPADDRGRVSHQVIFSGVYYATNGAYTLHVTGEDSGLVLSKDITISGESAVSDDSNVFYPEAPAISIPRTTITPDDLIDPGVPVTSTGFFPGERVTASLRGPSGIGDGFGIRPIGTFDDVALTQPADERGRWTYTAILNGVYYAPNGDYVLTLTGERSDLVLTQAFTVAGESGTSADGDFPQAVAGGDTLPVTGGGSSALALGGAAALMLLAGGALVLRRHRRTA